MLQEEPYKLTLFGKDNGKLPLMAADFLPDGRRLYIIAADDDCNLRVMEYDPEGTTSTSGPHFMASPLTRNRSCLLQRRSTIATQCLPHRPLHIQCPGPPTRRSPIRFRPRRNGHRFPHRLSSPRYFPRRFHRGHQTHGRRIVSTALGTPIPTRQQS